MSSPPALSATYTSSAPAPQTSTTETFSLPLPALPAADDTARKTAFLSALRSNVSQLQSDVNTMLTRKMDEEKGSGAQDTTGGGNRSRKQKDEEKEEEMYGEEDPEAEG